MNIGRTVKEDGMGIEEKRIYGKGRKEGKEEE